MTKIKKDSPLAKVLGDLGYDNTEAGESVSNMDDESDFEEHDQDTVTDVDNLDREEDKDQGDDKPLDQNNDTEHDDPLKDNTDVPEDVLKDSNTQTDTNENQDIDYDQDSAKDNTNDVDQNPDEAKAVSAFFDAFAEANGWDVSDDDKPKTVEEITDYIKDVVDQNSTPQYADDRIAQLDQYVKNGGSFEDFYSSQSKVLQYKDLDMEDESNQKAVVRDYLKLSGYDDKSINNKIERYEDADLLSEEANDAVDRLQSIQQQQLEQEQQRQQQEQQEQAKRSQQFVDELTSNIQNLDNIRGISIPKEDRRALFDYITRTDENGQTQYQKDFNDNAVNNLIESAYFTMKGDTLLGEAKRSGQTSAASKLKELLRHQTKNHSTYNADNRTRSVIDIASRIW